MGLVLRTGLWAFAMLVGGLAGAGFVKLGDGFGATTGGRAVVVVLAGFAVAGFVVACVMSAMETVFPVFRAPRRRRVRA
jgi:hypothetical protein